LRDKIKCDGTCACSVPDCVTWSGSPADYAAKAVSVGVLSTENEDVRSLRSLLTYGLKGIAAYAHHAEMLGKEDENIYAFLVEGLAALDKDLSADELVGLVLKAGESGVTTMALLDAANTGAYGNPEISEVNIGTRNNPGILISGHDLKDMEELLNAGEKERLLKIARETLKSYVETGKQPKFKEDDPVLNKEMGAFVTLHEKEQLRGCIGNIIGKGPLYQTVSDMAVQAGTQDPRFQPVSPEELEAIDIEISVLSPLEKVDNADNIIMGKHGVLVRNGFRSGVYLPQVAIETGWDKNEFMDSLCMQKAGMPRNSWKNKGCDIYIFSAEVFGEKEAE